MPAIKIFPLISILVFTLGSCIERYYPEEQIGFESKLVVEGIINNESERQKIVLSKSSPTQDPKFFPYSDCDVQVIDNAGNIFTFFENSNEPGKYYSLIDKQYLKTGVKYRLQITTPEQENYSSAFEEMLPSPPIENVYYEITSVPTQDPGMNIDGARFYIDFQPIGEFGTKYLFKLEETYEYHSTWPIRAFIDENGFQNPVDDYSKFVCYSTLTVPGIYLLSTSNLTENRYIKFPLHFVDDHTQRLLYNYSLFIRQYSLSESAYRFWEILKENNQDVESLYAQQPSILISNITNEDFPEKTALGYFGVSYISTYRLNLKKVKELSFKNVPYCSPTFPETGYPEEPRPLYLVRMRDPKDPVDGPLAWGYAGSECFDCTLLGGTVVKPPFFDNQ